jgi:hypothetical protein
LGKTTKHIQRKNMATLKLGAGVVPEWSTSFEPETIHLNQYKMCETEKQWQKYVTDCEIFVLGKRTSSL